jgi:hypothetical protein
MRRDAFPWTHFRVLYDILPYTMKTFQFVTLFALIAAAMAFAPNQVPQGKRYRLEYLSS